MHSRQTYWSGLFSLVFFPSNRSGSPFHCYRRFCWQTDNSNEVRNRNFGPDNVGRRNYKAASNLVADDLTHAHSLVAFDPNFPYNYICYGGYLRPSSDHVPAIYKKIFNARRRILNDMKPPLRKSYLINMCRTFTSIKAVLPKLPLREHFNCSFPNTFNHPK